MTKKKKLQLYTHHQTSVTIRKGTGSGFFNIVGSTIFSVLSVLEKVCFHVGSSLLWFFKISAKSLYMTCFGIGLALTHTWKTGIRGLRNDIQNTAISFSKRAVQAYGTNFRQSLGIFLLLSIVGWGIFFGAHIIAHGIELKDSIFGIALSGKDHLTAAETALKAQNQDQATRQFSLAFQNFKTSSEELNQSGAVINQLLNLIPQKREADAMLEAGGLVAQAGNQITSASSQIKSLSFSPEGFSSGIGFSETLKNIVDTLHEVTGELAQANDLIAPIPAGDIPSGERTTFIDLQNKISLLSKTISQVNGVMSLVQNLASGNKNVLVLFENNNELRPSGGFMGTFGNFKLNDGKIKNLHISSIYDLDGQLADVITPPTPILNVNDRWYLRDANWFIDFPTSAKKISTFYEKEGGETPDIIITLTPNIITDLLKLTGPVEIPAYHTILTSENFVEQTQVLTSVTDNTPLNSPKQMLADFFTIFLQRLSQLPPNQYGQVLQAVQGNLSSKQILVYSRDTETEQQLKAFNWAGDVKNSDRDYLSIVSSNLGGTKTDLSIDQKVSLQTEVGADGIITDTLTLTRTNRMPNLDHVENTSFIRLVVPQGATLISNTGFDYKNLDTAALKNRSIDPDVLAWEKSAVRDIVSGTTIGTEAGKSYFGNWLTVPGGQTKTVTIVYKLPFSLNTIDRYSLLLQKEPGANAIQFDQTVHFSGRKILWKNFTENSITQDSVTLSELLNSDGLIGIVLQKR